MKQIDNGALAREVLDKLRAIAMADVTDALQVRQGQLVLQDTEMLSQQQRCAIASVEKTATGIRVKFYDRLKALELLGKYLGLFDLPPSLTDTDDSLLQSILESTKEVIPTNDLPEIQQAAAAGNDLVE